MLQTVCPLILSNWHPHTIYIILRGNQTNSCARQSNAQTSKVLLKSRHEWETIAWTGETEIDSCSRRVLVQWSIGSYSSIDWLIVAWTWRTVAPGRIVSGDMSRMPTLPNTISVFGWRTAGETNEKEPRVGWHVMWSRNWKQLPFWWSTSSRRLGGFPLGKH
jgi:hypothetical protein